MRNIRAIIVLSLMLAVAGIATAQVTQSEASRKLDEFSGSNCEDMMAHLDSYAIALQSEPDLRAYIIVYGGQTSQRNEAQMWASRARSYLVGNRAIAAKRITTSVGGYRENPTMELWLVRKDAPLPVAKPTVQLKDVKFKSGRIKKLEYRCGI